jgi:hypothetical protein
MFNKITNITSRKIEVAVIIALLGFLISSGMASGTKYPKVY